MADPTRISPLDDFSGLFQEATTRTAGAVRLTELPFWGQLNLRIAADAGLDEQVATALGAALPREPGTTAASDSRQILWLGPDEWLILSPPGTDATLEGDLRRALADQPASVVEVSSGRTIIEIAGPQARALLSHGCALDLHRRAFPAGHCAQTMFAQAAIVLIAQDVDTPIFWLLVRASFADYLATYLLDALA
jgi:sarcosine oxidase subunit gamma